MWCLVKLKLFNQCVHKGRVALCKCQQVSCVTAAGVTENTRHALADIKLAGCDSLFKLVYGCHCPPAFYVIV